MELEDLVREYLKENSLKDLERELNDLKVNIDVLPKNPVAIAQAIEYALDSQPERLEYLEEYLKNEENEEKFLPDPLLDTVPSSWD